MFFILIFFCLETSVSTLFFLAENDDAVFGIVSGRLGCHQEFVIFYCLTCLDERNVGRGSNLVWHVTRHLRVNEVLGYRKYRMTNLSVERHLFETLVLIAFTSAVIHWWQLKEWVEFTFFYWTCDLSTVCLCMFVCFTWLSQLVGAHSILVVSTE